MPHERLPKVARHSCKPRDVHRDKNGFLRWNWRATRGREHFSVQVRTLRQTSPVLLPALYPGRRFDREKTSKPAGLLVLVKSPCVDPARPLRGTDGAHGEFPKSRLSFQFCLRYLQRARAVFAGIESGGTLNATPVDKLGGGSA